MYQQWLLNQPNIIPEQNCLAISNLPTHTLHDPFIYLANVTQVWLHASLRWPWIIAFQPPYFGAKIFAANEPRTCSATFHANFDTIAMLSSLNMGIPRPPSCFDLQILDHATVVGNAN